MMDNFFHIWLNTFSFDSSAALLSVVQIMMISVTQTSYSVGWLNDREWWNGSGMEQGGSELNWDSIEEFSWRGW
jgi:hypothetical protein